MTVTDRLFRTIALLGLVALFSPGCRKPESPKKETPAPKQERPGPQTESLPDRNPVKDEELVPDDGDVVPQDDHVALEIEPAPAPLVSEPHPIPIKIKPEAEEVDLRTKLHKMRRTVDRRLLWARRSVERRVIIEAERDTYVERAAGLDLAVRVPRGAQTESLGAAIQKSADDAGLTLTELTFDIAPPQVGRLPDRFAGNKPLDLTEDDFIGTVHVSFVLGTEDKARLAAWRESFQPLPRFLCINRLRHTGESFEVLADAYYIADREGPTRHEEATTIETELKRAGIDLTPDEVRQEDPGHFLLATEVSLSELSGLLDQANEIAEIEAGLKRNEVLHTWYEGRVKARAGRAFEGLLR